MIRNKAIISLFFMFFCFAILLSTVPAVHAAPVMRGDSGTAESVSDDATAVPNGESTTDGMTMPETNNNDVTSDQATLDLMPDTSDKATAPSPSTSDSITDSAETTVENKAETLGIIIAVIIAIAVVVLVVLIMSRTRSNRL